MGLPALVAHGIGGRTDLPLSVWMFGYGAAAALVVSFAALVLFWPTPRLEPVARRKAASGLATGPVHDDTAPAGTGGAVLGGLGVAALLVVLAAAAFGDELVTQNLAPVAVYVLFWVGLTIICSLVVDVWNAGLNPLATIGRLVAPDDRPYRLGAWPAAVGLLVFVWIELVYPDRAQPRTLAVLLVVYVAVVLAAAVAWGRPFLRHGETFAAWFGLIGAMAPIRRDAETGRLRPGAPLVGLARIVPSAGLVALVMVALGSTAFDGLTRSSFWSDFVEGRSATEAVPRATLGLLAAIAVVTALYLLAMRIAAAMTSRGTLDMAVLFVHSLVPIAVAYAVAHYFSLLVLEGQAAIALISDPFGAGWDLFGTAGRSIDYALVSPNAIAYVQVGAIVAGHVAGVVLAHDRALARLPRSVATRSQYPLLVAMVAYTVGGLGLLLGG